MPSAVPCMGLLPTPWKVHLAPRELEAEPAAAAGQVHRAEGRVHAALAHERHAHVAPVRQPRPGERCGTGARRCPRGPSSSVGPAPGAGSASSAVCRRGAVGSARCSRRRRPPPVFFRRRRRSPWPRAGHGRDHDSVSRVTGTLRVVTDSRRRRRPATSRRASRAARNGGARASRGSPARRCPGSRRAPTVRRRVGQHLLDQAAVLLLLPRRSPSSRREPARASASASLIASSSPSDISLAGPPAAGRARSVRGQVEQDSSGELALQPGHLCPQGAPRGRLGRGLPDATRRVAAGGGHPPTGALGFEPQKICVPTMPTRCTSTVFSTIDFAVAVPTPTGPPEAL